MPLLPSRYNTKNGHISEAEINASLRTDKKDAYWHYEMPFRERSNRNTAMGGRLYGMQLWQAEKTNGKWVTINMGSVDTKTAHITV